MTKSSVAEQINFPTIVANRYQVRSVLGVGGMAVVYQIYDTLSKRQLALKQLRFNENQENKAEVVEHFEHEYHTLSQLSHPNVIEVYEFGKDDTLPYYTMELLDGNDLNDLSPMPFQKACSFFIGVCSALGLLHSRRQLHRDLSPRNIHCVKGDKAKLIDFGSIMPMGPCKRVIGTPAFISPEMLGLLDLDARSDLFSLGATLYYALTGRSAYPAKSFYQVRDMWRSTPRAPSEWVSSIPKEMDQLVLSLIHIDPLARPMNTAIVMERLSAVADIELDERLVYSQAYLTTPKLIGRKKPLSRVKKRIFRMLKGIGSAVSIEGVSGVGRSRFLNACVLEGKLSGATILRGDASDAYKGDWGVVRTLSLQLLDAAPKIVFEAARPHVQMLSSILPELISRLEHSHIHSSIPSTAGGQELTSQSGVSRLVDIWARGFSKRPPPPAAVQRPSLQPSENPQPSREQLYRVLCDWIVRISYKRSLMLAIDDFHRIDEPSASLLALLAQEVEQQKIIILVTVDKDVPSAYDDTVKLLQKKSVRITLSNFNPHHTQRLLSSIFGDTANQQLLTDRIHTLSEGNPRVVMQYIQHLTDRGIASYKAGTWTLQGNIDDHELPSCISDALMEKVKALNSATRQLAQSMALSAEQNFTHEECLMLTEHRDRSQLLKSLDQLVTLKMVMTDGAHFSLSQKEWGPALIQQLHRSDERAYHLRLAAVFDQRGTELIRAASHLLRAGEEQPALERFIQFADRSREPANKNVQNFFDLIQSLPRDWFNTFLEVIQLAHRFELPHRQIYSLQATLCGLCAVTIYSTESIHLQLLKQLSRDSGLEAYNGIADSVPDADRLPRALEIAQQRYDSLPERERGFAPIEAIKQLARVSLQAAAEVAKTVNVSFLQTIPSIQPFVPLSPSLEVVEKLIQFVGLGTMGQVERAWQQNWIILQMLDQPDRAGMQESHYRVTRLSLLHSLGIYESIMGLRSALTYAEELEKTPLLQINACQIRMLYYLWQGDYEEAEKYARESEVLHIQNRSTTTYHWTYIIPKLLSFCLAEDLMGVKQLLSEIENLARTFPGWVPSLTYARGEYQRLRGDHSKALSLLREALEDTSAGRYRGWVNFGGSYLKNLYALERYQEAVTQGRRLLQTSEREGMGYLSNYLKMPLAMAEAKIGDYSSAIDHSESALSNFNQLGSTGLNLGLAYESRSYVAVFMNHRKDYQHYAELCAEQFRVGKNPILTAKYERLVQAAIRNNLNVEHFQVPGTTELEMSEISFTSQITSMFEAAESSKKRAQLTLELLIQITNSREGLLYLLKESDPILVAQQGDLSPPLKMGELVKEYISKETGRKKDITITCEQEDPSSRLITSWTGQEDDRHFPIVLGHYTDDGYAVTGVALLAIEATDDFYFPDKIIDFISRALYDIGDVSLISTSS